MDVFDLLEGLRYRWLTKKKPLDIEGLKTDVSQVNRGDCFLLLFGLHVQGVERAEEAVQRGATLLLIPELLWDETRKMKHFGQTSVIAVEDLKANILQLIRRFYGRLSRRIVLIGITGTKGKTSVAMLLKEALCKAGKKAGVIGTLGIEYEGFYEDIRIRNTTPDQITIYQYLEGMVMAGCEYVIMEVSSQALKTKRVEGMWFDYAIFTNLSEDHISKHEHPDFQDYFESKKKLFTQCSMALIHVSDAYGEEIAREAKCPCFTCSFCQQEADFYGMIKEKELLIEGKMDAKLRASDYGEFWNENLLISASMLHLLGLPQKSFIRVLEMTKVKGRMERIEKDGYDVIIDYAHNEQSMKEVLKSQRKKYPGRVIVVFGCGGNRDKNRRIGMGRAAAAWADVVILTEDNSREESLKNILLDIKKGMGKRAEDAIVCLERKEAIWKAMDIAKSGDVVLLLGKGHETYIEKEGKRIPFCEKEIVLSYEGH